VSSLKKVSIIVPVYNTGGTLLETIWSIDRQTYSNIEVIIVDDGSNDEDTIKRLRNIGSDITVIVQKNMGLPAARNTGIKAASGEYIICLDSDDRLSKRYVEKVVKVFEGSTNNKLAIVSTYVQAFGVSSEQWAVPDFDKNILKYSNVLPVASMFRKDVWEKVGGYDESFRKGFEDWDFWLSIVENGYEWSVINEPLFYYRRKTNSMITDSNKNRETICRDIIHKHKALFESESVDAVLARMSQAELARGEVGNKIIHFIRVVFNKNFLKRFEVFR